MSAVPSSPADRVAIQKAVKEISDSMTRIEGERDFIKEATNNTCNAFQLSKKTFNKLVRVYHQQNYNRVKEENEEFEEMYETITNQTTMKAEAA